MLRHLPPFIACTGEKDEFQGRLVDDFPATGGEVGLVKRRAGFAGVKAAFQARLLGYSNGTGEHSSLAARTVTYNYSSMIHLATISTFGCRVIFLSALLEDNTVMTLASHENS